ncbi:MAG: ATP-binding protein, partial [Campylobacterota bacterium]|nr:ATP-binding protein [Campylobacterota bacterium]
VINDEKLKRNLLEDNNKIIEGIERIERIVDSMREMSQKSREEHSEVNIYQTLITSLTMAYNRSKHIAPIMLQDNLFTPEINSKLHECYVVAQHQRLEQAWIIIINNALDILNQNGSYASNEFKIQYTVNESNVIIEFTDNGGGIDESVLNTLFEPFVSTKEHGGIGIGLNIAKKIIYDHQGKIRAYNRNAGAVIEVTLPAVK